MPPLELVVELLTRLILPAAAASTLVAAAVAWRRIDSKWYEAIAAAAVLAGLAGGNLVRGSFPFVPDYSGWRWFLISTSGVLAVGAVASFGQCDWLTAGLAVAAALGVGYFLIPDASLHTPAWLGGTAALLTVQSVVLGGIAQRYPGWMVPAMSGLALCGGTTMLLLYAGSARLAEGGILLGAALVGPAILGLSFSLPLTATMPALALGLGSLLLAGHYDNFTDVPAVSFLIAALSPLPLAVLLLPLAQKWPTWLQFLLIFLLPLLGMCAAVGLAIRAVGFELGA